jgi:hypothetical protein
MHSLVLVLALLGADDFQWQFSRGYSEGFKWAVDSSQPSKQPVAKSLRDLIAEYKTAGGTQAYVRGKTDAQHLVEDHGWTYDQIRGLTVNEQRYLHGASHKGKITPDSLRPASRDGETDNPPSEKPPGVHKPAITIVSPATWDCQYCPGYRNQDWSAFNVTFEKRDGLAYYPATEWTDKRGVTQRLSGTYKPDKVMWSYKKTMED